YPPTTTSASSSSAAPSTEFHTLSLHDALPIYRPPREDVLRRPQPVPLQPGPPARVPVPARRRFHRPHGHRTARIGRSRRHEYAGASRRRDRPIRAVRCRSEEHTSELQSRFELVCRPLLEKQKVVQIEGPFRPEHGDLINCC